MLTSRMCPRTRYSTRIICPTTVGVGVGLCRLIQAFMTISDYWTFFEHTVLLPFFTTMESYHRLPSASCFPLTVCGYPSTECCLAVDTWFPFSHWHRHSQADFPKGSVWDRALYASDSAGWAACSPPTPSPVLGELHTHSCPTPLSVSLPCPWVSRPLHHAILSAPNPHFQPPVVGSNVMWLQCGPA